MILYQCICQLEKHIMRHS